MVETIGIIALIGLALGIYNLVKLNKAISKQADISAKLVASVSHFDKNIKSNNKPKKKYYNKKRYNKKSKTSKS